MSLYVNEMGKPDAPAIVFLHGMGVSSWMWQLQMESLCNSHRCLAIDLPGNGESYTCEWQSLSNTADQIARTIHERAPASKAHIVGLSLGGYVALEVLANHPDVVNSVIVSGVSTRPLPNQGFMRLLAGVMGKMTHWDPVIAFYAKMMQMPADVMPLYKRDSKRLSATTINRIYDELLGYHLPQELKARPHRLLGVAGDQEAPAIKVGLKDLASATQHSVAAIAPKAHHGWNGEHPQLFSDMIRAWVSDQTLPVELSRVAS